jgi:hypothetical protein
MPLAALISLAIVFSKVSISDALVLIAFQRVPASVPSALPIVLLILVIPVALVAAEL